MCSGSSTTTSDDDLEALEVVFFAHTNDLLAVRSWSTFSCSRRGFSSIKEEEGGGGEEVQRLSQRYMYVGSSLATSGRGSIMGHSRRQSSRWKHGLASMFFLFSGFLNCTSQGDRWKEFDL